VVGIDILPWLLDQLAQYPDDNPMFDLLVIDEILAVCATRRASASRRWPRCAIAGAWWWGLTGTLRPNGAEDLFMPARV